MEADKKDFNNTINELENLTAGFKQFSDIENYEQIATDAKNIKQRIDEANDYAKKINNCENLVAYDDISDYTSIPQMQKDFKSYYDLWTVVENWKKTHHSWLHDPFDEIDASNVENLVDDSAKIISACIRFFRDKDDLRKILKIAEEMRTGIDDFKPQVPILMALRTEGMKDRHWEVLSEKVGFEVKPYEGFTYQKCMEMKLTEHTEAVVDIGEKAGKEYNIETSLAKMKQDWEPLQLGLKPFKNTGTYTVFGFDDAMMMLDEHIVLTQTMQFSPFKKVFEDEIEEWNTILLYVSDCIDEWMKVQGQWMYL
jgi:dynein heavy chain